MNLVDALKKFNRKERYWLIQEALGKRELCEEFRAALKYAFKNEWPDLYVPKDAYWATDYHIDWLVGVAATLRENGELDKPHENREKHVLGTQEDFDLVIAFESKLILVECKAGSGWDPKQLKRKICRYQMLRKRFGDHDGAPNVEVRFAVLSPKMPKKGLLVTSDECKLAENGPELPWLELVAYKKEANFWRVVRCSGEGNQDKNGGRYKISVV